MNIFNYLIEQNNYKSYLEIGLDNAGTFNSINIENKYSVDPYFMTGMDNIRREEDIPKCLTWRMTSDEMFETVAKDMKFDLIYIDGMHTEEQVGRDIINGLKHLNVGGKLVCDDCIPASYEAQIVPRIQGLWNGDVWKAIVMLDKYGVSYRTINEAFGWCVIDYTENLSNVNQLQKCTITYEEFERNKSKLLHIITMDEFIELYKK